MTHLILVHGRELEPAGSTLVSNPHDLYGYPMNQDAAKFIAGWAE